MKTAIESNVIFLPQPRVSISDIVIETALRAVLGLFMFATVLTVFAVAMSPLIGAVWIISKFVSITLR